MILPLPILIPVSENVWLANLAIVRVVTISNAPPTNAPAIGTVLTRLIEPVVPNLVTRRKPTAWFIFVSTEPGTFLIAPSAA